MKIKVHNLPTKWLLGGLAVFVLADSILMASMNYIVALFR
jgi:hypothetical protein